MKAFKIVKFEKKKDASYDIQNEESNFKHLLIHFELIAPFKFIKNANNTDIEFTTIVTTTTIELTTTTTNIKLLK